MDQWKSGFFSAAAAATSYAKAAATASGNAIAAVGEELKQQAALMSDESMGITYVGRQLIACGFPYDDSTRVNGATVALPVPSQATGSVRQLAAFLHKNHGDKFMVYNLSEKTYDYTALDNQVIEFKFPGYPAPPLSQVFSMCNSIHAWLQADPANVAVLHCQTGRGRTVCALTWYLAWSGQIASVSAALQHVCHKMSLPASSILIPTQQRYLDYLSTILSGKAKPSAAPVVLERVLMNGVPKLGDRIPRGESSGLATTAAAAASGGDDAVRPYLQIFKDARLIYTSTGLDRDSSSAATGEQQLRWYTAQDQCVLFPVGLELEGDILIRVRHLSSSNKRVSMLRCGFHTAFVPCPGNTRLLRAQLDGAAGDSRFGEDFFVDLVFQAPQEPDAQTEQGQAAIQAQKEQQQWWNQIHEARKQKPASKADLLTSPSPPPAVALPVAQPATAATAGMSVSVPSSSPSGVATAGSPASAWPASAALATPPKSKLGFGSLLSSATSKISLSLWGGPDAAAVSKAEEESHGASGSPGGGASGKGSLHLDLSNPAVRKLHEADQEALRKARRKAATEAAVAAALQTSPSAKRSQAAAAAASSASSSAGGSSKPPAGSDPDSFADLQAYVQGLGSLEAQQIEVNSDDEHDVHELHGAQQAASTKAKANTQQAKSAPTAAQHAELDLLGDSAPSKPAASSTSTAAAAPSDDDIFASLGLPTSPVKIASPVSGQAQQQASKAPTAEEAAAASLEAELAALSAEDLHADGNDTVLDDADEAALLASLEDELADD